MYGGTNESRTRACEKQCRIKLYINGESITKGNCPCDAPNECKFGLGDVFAKDVAEANDDEPDTSLLFPDVKQYYRALWSE
jgi:hypothetical protein